MELTKLNVSYTLKDITDTLQTEGRISVEQNGTVHIDITSNAITPVDGSFPKWGSANYLKQADGKVNVYFNFANNYRAEYVNYCETLFSEILQQIVE